MTSAVSRLQRGLALDLDSLTLFDPSADPFSAPPFASPSSFLFLLKAQRFSGPDHMPVLPSMYH